MKRSNIIAIVSVVLTVILTGVSLALLPETVTTQFSLGGGDSTTMSKLYAVAPPALFGLGGAMMTLFGDRGRDSGGKGILISAVGLLILPDALYILYSGHFLCAAEREFTRPA